MAANAEVVPVIMQYVLSDHFLQLVSEFNEIFIKLVNYINTISEQLENIFEEADRTQYEYEEARAKFREFSRCAYNYVNAVDNLFYHTQRINKERIKDSIRGSNYQPLIEFLHIIRHYISITNDKFTELKRASQNAERFCVSAAEHFKKLARKANVAKTATKVVGGAASGALIAGGVGTGVALSVVAGFFTFGVGTVVGLGLTAAGAGAAGVGAGAATAVATHVAASKLEDTQMKFADTAGNLDQLYRSSVTLDDKCESIKSALELVSRSTEDTQYHLQQRHQTEIMIQSVDLLFEKLSSSYDSTSDQRSYTLRSLN